MYRAFPLYSSGKNNKDMCVGFEKKPSCNPNIFASPALVYPMPALILIV
jgi:hypothetical protein